MRPLQFFFSATLVVLCIGSGCLIALLTTPALDFSTLEQTAEEIPSRVLDRHGEELFRFQRDKRTPIPLQAMPRHLYNAFVATEDRSFYRHHGVYWRGIIRSILVNARHKRVVQGGSTITQQLVKLLFCTQERTLKRKLHEQLLAYIVELRFSKEHILQTYLNHVYFGGGIYGVEAAARRFWNKNVRNLTIAESATLASIVKSPGTYSPLYHPERCQQRRNLVLALMHQTGYISQEEKEHEQQREMQLAERKDRGPHAGNLKNLLLARLENRINPHLLYTHGYTIKTTIDKKLQYNAENALTRHVDALRTTTIPECQGACVSLDVATGGIRALVGGSATVPSQFNRAYQSQRQLGSLFKPLSYAAALLQGGTFADTVIDQPFRDIADWNPRNVHRTHEGRITLARGLSSSNNIAAIKTFLQAGHKNVASLAQSMGLPGPFPQTPSLALGCTESSPLQAAGMMNTFVADGVYREPYLIEWVKDGRGTKVWRHIPKERRIIPWIISSQMVKALEIVTTHLREYMPSRWIPGASMGKTGTTNGRRTCWFAGATPEMTTVVYLGCDNNTRMDPHVGSVKHAVPLWLDINRSHARPGATFFYHPHLRAVNIDPRSGEYQTSDTNKKHVTVLVPDHTTSHGAVQKESGT